MRRYVRLVVGTVPLGTGGNSREELEAINWTFCMSITTPYSHERPPRVRSCGSHRKQELRRKLPKVTSGCSCPSVEAVPNRLSRGGLPVESRCARMLGVLWYFGTIAAAYMYLLGSGIAHALTPIETAAAAVPVGTIVAPWIVYIIASLISNLGYVLLAAHLLSLRGSTSTVESEVTTGTACSHV